MRSSAMKPTFSEQSERGEQAVIYQQSARAAGYPGKFGRAKCDQRQDENLGPAYPLLPTS